MTLIAFQTDISPAWNLTELRLWGHHRTEPVPVGVLWTWQCLNKTELSVLLWSLWDVFPCCHGKLHTRDFALLPWLWCCSHSFSSSGRENLHILWAVPSFQSLVTAMESQYSTPGIFSYYLVTNAFVIFTFKIHWFCSKICLMYFSKAFASLFLKSKAFKLAFYSHVVLQSILVCHEFALTV